MRSRQPGMSPEKIAIAVAVTIAAIAGIGGMKNVTGTSSAVAIVAVSPGTAPTNRPNSDAPSMTSTLYGSKTRRNASAHAGLMRPPRSLRSLPPEGARPALGRPGARPSRWRSPRDPLQHAPRQRHAQQLVERVVDRQRHEKGDRQRDGEPNAQHPHQRGEVHERGQQEAEPI